MKAPRGKPGHGAGAPRLPARRLLAVYRALHRVHGPQSWWPGDTPFEIMVGAVLTQNTAWSNVERAIANLKAHDALDPQVIAAAPLRRLAGWVRPSGYFNVKARRLQSFCRWYLEAGTLHALSRRTTPRLRTALLDVHGVGPETADDILLYAFGRPVFVIDAYTRRIFARLGMIGGREPYEALREAFERALGADAALFNEYHALLVMHGKDRCRPRPRCGECALRRMCPAAQPAGVPPALSRRS